MGNPKTIQVCEYGNTHYFLTIPALIGTMAWTDLSTLTQVEAIIWFVGVGIGVFLTLYFLKQIKTTEFPQAKKFFTGLCIFAASYSVARLIENIRKYFVSENLTDIVDAWQAGTQITGLNLTLRIAYYAISWPGIAIFYFHAERYVFQNKTKFILTIASLVEGTVSILQYFYDPGSAAFQICTVIAAIGFFVAGVFPVLLFFNMARTTTGSVRKNNALVGVGLTLFIVGVMADLPETGYIMQQTLPQLLTGIGAACFLFAGFIVMAYAFRSMYSSTVS